MRSFLRWAAIPFAAVVLAALAAFPAAPEGDALWLKAIAVAAKAKDDGISPGKIEMKTFVRKKDGKLDSQSTVLLKVVGEGDDSKTEIISVIEDGIDVTEKAKAEERKALKERESKKPKKEDGDVAVELEPGYHPFDPEIQGRVTYRRLGDESLDGKRGVAFTFKHQGKEGKGTLEGKAWIEADTGVPLKVVVSPVPLPKHVDSMKSTIRFEVAAGGGWRPITSEMTGEGGMLWIQRKVETTFRFLDWQKKR